MPSIIRVLDDQTINKIAAGEVIENPSSVVKELVENAIDAESSEITVEIKGGGRQLIRITDNGIGMSPDDALLSLERHATSKIRSIEDINSIASMGFRGEAVPSIASISKLTLLTRTPDAGKGTYINVEGGKIINCSPADCALGTTFEIKSLFFNVPVRKKFQRSPTYDAAEILKVISTQALAHPEIKFQLIHNGESLLALRKPAEEHSFQKILGERVSEVLGRDFSAGLYPLKIEEKGFKLTGFIGAPTYTRHNRTGQHLFINRRAVISHRISYAVREGYGTTLGTNRHPVYVLHLEMDGSFVDVNVHPQKREVRLREELKLKEVVIQAVESALQNSGIQTFRETPSFSEPPAYRFTPQPYREWAPEPKFSQTPLYEQMDEGKEDNFFNERVLFEEAAPIRSKVVTSVKGYLLLETENGKLELLDQKRAHARILYEQLLNKDKSADHIALQNLLIPYTLELSKEETDTLKENLTYLSDMGLQIEEFGASSFIVRSLPELWGNDGIQDLIKKIIHDLQEFQYEGVNSFEREKNLALAAGRAATTQKSKLTLTEGHYLYRELMKCQFSNLCPSGKPTIVELTQEEIAKQFQK